MDGINNQFRVNALNQVLDNSYQKFLPGNDSYNSLGSIEQVKALKFYDLMINFNPQSEKLESALFFKQIAQYAKGLRLKILTGRTTKKDLERLEQLEQKIKEEQERLNAKDLNTLAQEILKEQENALKLKESSEARQKLYRNAKERYKSKRTRKKPHTTTKAKPRKPTQRKRTRKTQPRKRQAQP